MRKKANLLKRVFYEMIIKLITKYNLFYQNKFVHQVTKPENCLQMPHKIIIRDTLISLLIYVNKEKPMFPHNDGSEINYRISKG